MRYGPDSPDETYVPHAYPEHTVDLGEVVMNYAVAGDPSRPPLLLIPGQSESWWGYESAMKLLEPHFRVHAVDLRGQGRSSRTPGRYTLDNFGNDLVRFMALVIRRPVVVSGLSSGGLLATWLAAYALPGTVRGAHLEDPPLFSAELHPACGPSQRQAVGPVFALWSKYLGDQWSVGDWQGLVEAAPRELPPPFSAAYANTDEPPQNLKEYDPEWARSFIDGRATASYDSERVLQSVKVPTLLTHHFRHVDEATGRLIGALSDLQAQRVRELIGETGQPFEYQSHPQMGHSMHGPDPELFARILLTWAEKLD